MVTFENAIAQTATVLSQWSEYAKLAKATIVRGAHSKISLFLEAKNMCAINDVAALQSSLAQALGPAFSGDVYGDWETNEAWFSDLFRKVAQLRARYDTTIAGCDWYVLERGVAKKAWIQRANSEESVWSYDEACASRQPKVVTFYSFKGGMGRTTALAAVALELARRGKNVLMVDTDVEAPGLATLFVDPDSPSPSKGVVEYLLARLSEPQVTPAMRDYITQLSDSASTAELAGSLYLVPAGRMDDNYLLKLARIDSQETVEGVMRKRLSELLSDCRDELAAHAQRPDYILLDARAGFHDMGGVVTTQLPHGVVLFGKDTEQSWFGTRQVLMAIATSQAEKPFVAMVDSHCGTDGIVNDEEKRSFREKSFTAFCELFYSPDDVPGIEAEGEAHQPIFVPYAPGLSSNLRLYGDASGPYVRMLSAECYGEIADRVLSAFGEEESRDV